MDLHQTVAIWLWIYLGTVSGLQTAFIQYVPKIRQHVLQNVRYFHSVRLVLICLTFFDTPPSLEGHRCLPSAVDNACFGSAAIVFPAQSAEAVSEACRRIACAITLKRRAWQCD